MFYSLVMPNLVYDSVARTNDQNDTFNPCQTTLGLAKTLSNRSLARIKGVFLCKKIATRKGRYFGFKYGGTN